MPSTTAELAIEGYRSARSFWETWHKEDDAELMFGTRNPSSLVAQRLAAEYGMVPAEAEFVSSMANLSVVEALYQN